MSEDNDQFLSFLLEDLKGPVILFLGAGSSMEGVRVDGTPYPSFEKIQREIIERFGNARQKEEIENTKNRIPFETFLNVVKELAKENKVNSVLRDFLKGKPSHTHFQLAATILAKGTNLFLILTSNYDELFDSAMYRLSESASTLFKVYSIKEIADSDISQLTRELPVLIKLFGDLGIHPGLFHIRDLHHQVYGYFRNHRSFLSNPILFIGYSFSDELYHALLEDAGGTVYIVDPIKITPNTNRVYRQFKGTFSQFMQAFLEKLKENQHDLCKKIDDLLISVDPKSKFHRIEDAEPLLRALGQRGLGTVEGRFQLQRRNRGNRKFLIHRREAGEWVKSFLASSHHIMLLLGESGLGKSCFLYETAIKSPEQVIVSFFAGSTLVNNTAIFGKIGQELGIVIDQIKTLFLLIDRLLTAKSSNKQWLIIIDALNESPVFQKIWDQILDIASWGLIRIKILYSCRTVFWESNQLANDQLKKMHFSGWSCRIKNFTEDEAETAYRNYQSLLKIPTQYDDVHPLVKKHMTNPLMMRMIVQTYEGKRLLEYIPATTVFDNYWNHLSEKCKIINSPLKMEVLKLLAMHKIHNYDDSSKISNDLFFLDDFLGDHLVTEQNILAWQDEGLLVWIDTKTQSFRFSFDRFYEFTLSRALLSEYRNQGEPEPISWILRKYRTFDNAHTHFSYQEALKSTLVHFGLEKRPLDIAAMVRLIPNLAYRSFLLQCLRELLFETDQPIIETFEQVTEQSRGDEAKVFMEAQLTLASNSPKVIDSALKGVFSGDEPLAHRCVQLLLSLDAADHGLVREKARETLKHIEVMDEANAYGLLYLYVLYFCRNHRSQDPVDSLTAASCDYLGLVMLHLDHHAKLTSALAGLFQHWGPHLFSTTSRVGENPFDYPWSRMGVPERKFALLVGEAVSKEFADLTSEDYKAIRFFSMELPEVAQMNQPRPQGLPQEYPLESKLSQWALIRHGRTHFDEIIRVLDGFMHTRDFCTSDFCICLLKDILAYHFQPGDYQFRQGYEQLKLWTDYFCKHDEYFFDVLRRKDAYYNTYNPLEEAAGVYANLHPLNPTNVFLDGWILSDDLKRKKLGLLAVRRMWRKNGIQVLRSANGLFQHMDPEIHSWLNLLMKEVSLFDRRLYEQYLAELKLPHTRLKEIEDTESAFAKTENYRVAPLIKMFFNHGVGRIRLLQKWHRKIYQSESLYDYLYQLADHLVKWQKEEYLNRQSAFSDP